MQALNGKPAAPQARQVGGKNTNSEQKRPGFEKYPAIDYKKFV